MGARIEPATCITAAICSATAVTMPYLIKVHENIIKPLKLLKVFQAIKPGNTHSYNREVDKNFHTFPHS